MVPVLEEIFILKEEKNYNRKHTENMIDYKNEEPIMLILEYQTRQT